MEDRYAHDQQLNPTSFSSVPPCLHVMFAIPPNPAKARHTIEKRKTKPRRTETITVPHSERARANRTHPRHKNPQGATIPARRRETKPPPCSLLPFAF